MMRLVADLNHVRLLKLQWGWIGDHPCFSDKTCHITQYYVLQVTTLFAQK